MEHPGDGPDHGANHSAARMVETNRTYDKKLKKFDIYTALEASLKRQLLEAIRPIDVDALNDNLYGFALSSTYDILQHLRTTHGKITPENLCKNLLELDRKWQPPEEIGSLFKQIKDCHRLAIDDDDPITKKTVIRSVLENIKSTGLFSYACSKWQEKDDPEQTLSLFAVHFTDADTERQRKATSESAGYHDANTARQAPAPVSSITNYSTSTPLADSNAPVPSSTRNFY
jgi:hypothetical protein